VYDRAYGEAMDYEWDARKAVENAIKHGVRFADAIAVFQDERALTLHDSLSDEERYVTLGLDGIGRILVVVYTWRGLDTIRVISATPPALNACNTRREAYEAQL